MSDDAAKGLADALTRARKAAKQLHAETDGINAEILRAENALSHLGVGVSTAVKLYDNDDGYWTYVGYGKVDRQWRLTLEVGNDPDDIEVSPLANASREVRLIALEKLPELIDNIVRQTEKEAAEVARAREKARAFNDELMKAIVLSSDPIQMAVDSDVVNPLPQLPPLTEKSTAKKISPYSPIKGTGAAIADGIVRGARVVEVPTKKPSGGGK